MGKVRASEGFRSRRQGAQWALPVIYIRHRYTTQPDYAYDVAAWATRPQLAGPNPTTAIEDDARLDEVLKRGNDRFGQPGVMCPPLPAPRVAKKGHK